MLSSQCDGSSRTAVHVTQWCYSLWVMGRESHNMQGLRNGQLEAQLISPTPPTRLLWKLKTVIKKQRTEKCSSHLWASLQQADGKRSFVTLSEWGGRLSSACFFSLQIQCWEREARRTFEWRCLLSKSSQNSRSVAEGDRKTTKWPWAFYIRFDNSDVHTPPSTWVPGRRSQRPTMYMPPSWPTPPRMLPYGQCTDQYLRVVHTAKNVPFLFQSDCSERRTITF